MGKLVGGTGRAAACRRCTNTDANDGCACLIFCGHPRCSGSKDPEHQGNVPMDWPVRKPRKMSDDTKPPHYDGPRGKAK